MHCCNEKFFPFGNIIYYSQNNIGSTTLLTDKDGSDIGQFLYTPFGEMWVDEASTVNIDHITRFFTNQQYDKESGLYYYNARYYDPHLGSFITPDPAMDGLNHYAYCSANPIKYTDPTGLTTGSWEQSEESVKEYIERKEKEKKEKEDQYKEILKLKNKLKDNNLSDKEKRKIYAELKYKTEVYMGIDKIDSGALKSDPILFEIILGCLGAPAIKGAFSSAKNIFSLFKKAGEKNKQEPEFNLQRFSNGKKINSLLDSAKKGGSKGKNFNPWKDTKTGTKDVNKEMLKLKDAADKAASLKKSREAIDLADAFDAVISNNGLTRIISIVKNWFKK